MKQIRPLGGALRLEIADDPAPGELVNLIQNPSGTLGGWGWVTPVAGTAMSSHRDATAGVWWLDLLIATGGQATWLTSEPLPVLPLHWAVASYKLPATGPGYHRTRFEWLDVNRVLLSSSAQSAYVGNNAGTRPTLGPMQAPATAAYVRLRFDVYSSVGGAAPTTATALSFTETTAATASTSAGLGTVRTNMIPNPSLETGIAGYVWQGLTGSLTQGTAGAVAGKSLQLNGPQQCGARSPLIPVIAGHRYTYSLWFRCNRIWTAETYVFTSRAVLTGGAYTTFPIQFARTAVTANVWQRKSVTFTAPPGATMFQASLDTAFGLNSADWAQVDGLMLEETDELGDYFDGDTTDTAATEYAWTGTAHASTSTAAALTTLPYIPPPTLDILGPSHDLTVTREGLNVGTLTAHIVDSTLDPATSELIRPGRAIRLMAFDTATSVWRHVFTGTVSAAQVTYDLKRPEETKRAQIELTATDNGAALANQNRANGYATIDELPAVLEGCGVPWNCNGSGAQVTTATLVAINENASALDQVAVTRDSVLGYAWVDRMGVLQAWDRDQISDVVLEPDLDESVYRDVVVGYNTEALINEVRLKFLRLNPGDGTSEEVPYGPYRDEDSIREWGVRSAEFTIQGIAEETANLDEYAQAILDASSVPEVRLTQMDTTVELTADGAGVNPGSWFAFLDLYDLVSTTNERAGLGSEPARVSSIKHTLSGPDSKWQIELGFEKVEGVASPTFVPSPAVGAEGQTIGDLLRPIGEVSMFYGLKTACPSGWLVMDGGPIGPEYPDLRAMVGSTVLPDMTDRFPIGAGTKAKGTVGGLPTHTHPLSDNAQAQIAVFGTLVGGRRIPVATNYTESSRFTGPTATAVSSGQGTPLRGDTDNASEGLPPWRALWFIIRCGAAKPVTIGSYISEVLADAPSVVWLLNDTDTGSTAVADSSGNGKTGVKGSGVTFGAAGLIAGYPTAATFGGASSATNLIDVALTPLADNAPYTLEAWVKTSIAAGVSRWIVGDIGSTAGATRGGMLAPFSTGAGFGGMRVYNTSNTSQGPDTASVINNGAAHHLVGTFGPTGVRIYLDGALAGGPTTTTGTIRALQSFRAGGAAGGANAYSGVAAGLALYPTELSAARIAVHYDAGT